jgi:TolB protein
VKRIIAFVSLVLAAAVTATAPASAQERPSGKLLIHRYFPGRDQADLFLASTSGRTRRLTQTKAFESSAAFSPDGSEIAFVRRARRGGDIGLYVMRRDGTRVRALVDDAFAGIEWDPTGRFISFIRTERPCSSECSLSLGMVEVDTGEVRLLSESEWIESHVEWSPDGRHLVFAQRTAAGADQPANEDVYLAAADGSSLVRLTESAATDTSPTFAPEGDEIAFVTTRDDPSTGCVDCDGPYSSEIYVMQTDGDQERPVTQTPDTWDESPTWHPRGRLQILFERRYDDDVRTGPDSDTDLYLVNPDSGEPDAVTQDRRIDDLSPMWSPDGRWIAFERRPFNNDSEVYIIDPSGDRLLRITDNNRPDDSLSDWWMPAS